MDKETDNEGLSSTIQEAVYDIAYCLGELGFSKADIDKAFANRCDTDEYFAESWQSAYQANGDDYWFRVVYSRLPDNPGEGQMVYIGMQDGRGTE